MPTRPIVLVGDPALTAIVRRCYTDAEFVDPAGMGGRGYTNLKRIYGSPADLRAVVDALASTVGAAGAVASTDTGSAPLAALVAYERSLPAVFVRSAAKESFLSYGGDPGTNDPRLFGERLPPGTVVHVVDDFVHSGATLASAIHTLRDVGLIVRTAAAVLGSPPEAISGAIDPLDVTLTIFVSSEEIS